MAKEKFDLSNVGGQPKDWMQREREKSLEPGLGFKEYAGCAGLILLLLITLGAVAAWLLDIDIISRPLKPLLAALGGGTFLFFAAKEITESISSRRARTDRAIDNTWSRITRVEAEIKESIGNSNQDYLIREARLERQIADLERRLRKLEQRDLDVFGD